MSELLKTLAGAAEAPTGTYVGAKVDPFTDEHRTLFQVIKGLKGAKIGADKLHITVVFSRDAYVDPGVIEPAIKLYKLPIKAKIVGAAAFDALPAADGSRDEQVSTMVIKLECQELLELHAACKSLGCTHTYPELSPHVSLFYGVPTADCKQAVDSLNAAITALPEPLYVNLTSLYSEPIKPNWAASNTSKRT